MPDKPFGISTLLDQTDDAVLISRIVSAYRKAESNRVEMSDSMWTTGNLYDLRQDIHNRLMSDNPVVVQDLLRDPGNTDLFYGFEDNARSLKIPMDSSQRQAIAAGGYELVLLLSEALGVTRLRKPLVPTQEPELNELIHLLDAALGIEVNFPNPFPGEMGIHTSRGIVTYRATHALYQAWRIRQLLAEAEFPRVVEIGAGLGRTAYYAWQLGIRDYTIVDLPITCVAQANFLGRTLGEHRLQLHGESKMGCVRIIPPEEFLRMSDCYDLALNVDSITEMSLETARMYFEHIDSRANRFLSINHESNPFRARDLFANRCHSRFPYWLRPGYVEEIVETAKCTNSSVGASSPAQEHQ